METGYSGGWWWKATWRLWYSLRWEITWHDLPMNALGTVFANISGLKPTGLFSSRNHHGRKPLPRTGDLLV
uniref:Uncharacterized protein n=1 Tax=Hyaloperonospora arabidopsidis (strain Emoy2) TaxID=559515 RepID=M4BAJ3_HYAAE